MNQEATNKKKTKPHLFKALNRLWKNIRLKKRSGLYICYIVNMICNGILPILVVIAPKLIIDIIEKTTTLTDVTNELNNIYIIIAIYVGASLLLVVFAQIVGAYTAKELLYLRTCEYDNLVYKLQEIDYEYLEDANYLDKLDTVQVTLSGNNNGFEGSYHILYNILPLFLSIILYIVILWLFNALLVGVCLLGAIVSLLVTIIGGKYAYKRKEDLARARRYTQYYYETTYNFEYGKDIRIYQLVDKISKDYQTKSYSYLTVIKNIKNKEFLLGLWELLMLLMQDALGYFLIIRAYSKGLISIGDVSLYIAAVIALGQTLRDIGLKMGNLNNETRYVNDYYNIIDDPSVYSKNDKAIITSLNTDTIEIEFQDVSFKYPNTERYIFEHLNLKIAKSEKLAIVGTNGAGKTTIIKLILGLFKPTSGKIFVNGHEISDYDRASYYSFFGVVFQDYKIFAATIIENVCGNDTGIEARKRAIECLARVGLTDKIESLPNQYDTQLLKIIYEDGIEMSGGQTQKIAIARALYKNANMVILDEPTAALDALTEAEIYQNFDDLVQHKTAIYISHRLSSTKFCDHIAMFSDLGLIEYGTHDELMAKHGAYYEMFVVQGKYYQENKEDEVNEGF